MNSTIEKSRQSQLENAQNDITRLRFVLSKNEDFYIVSGTEGVAKSQIHIPEEYKGLPVRALGNRAFFNLRELKELYIPRNILSLSGNQFERCINLEKISVEKGNREYHSEGDCLIESESGTVILGCKNSVIPEGAVIIGGYSFRHCRGLETLKLPSSLKIIRPGAFVECSGLVGISVDPENKTFFSEGNCLIQKKEKRLVLGCKNSIIPKSHRICVIGDSAFSGCSELQSIAIPDNIMSIGSDAFYKCVNLREISIPYNVRFICDGAFFGCKSLTTIIYNGTKEEWEEIKKGSYWNTSTGEYAVRCTDGYIEKRYEKF